jgi:hypothetical protein
MNTVQQTWTSKVDDTLSFLTRNNFSCAKDSIGEYSRRSILYYKQVDDDTFIVVNHFNAKLRKDLQGFDMWLSKYNRPSEIGSKKAKSIRGIKLSVHLPDDAHLMEHS